MNTKITLNIGLGFDKDQQPIDPQRVNEAEALLRDCATRLAGGCTLWRATGAWRQSPGSPVVLEPVLVLDVVVDGGPSFTPGLSRAEVAARELASLAKLALNQECVAVILQPITFLFL